jgi:hypothetical protein
MDPDTDGDGVLDGYDDQDHDGISNIDEWATGTWAMNPCDPLNRESPSCPRWFNADAPPERPEHLCLSQTLTVEGGYVLGLKTFPVDVAPCWYRSGPGT